MLLLATLGFLATGTFQQEMGDRAGVSQPTLSRVMPEVLGAIKSLSSKYIKLPHYYEIAGIPNVIGLGLGSHH